ncbi:radial spoke head 10 homolog B-like isoform X1 [Amblyraja radiata]|uniref:radial spoke head 10 homolog B-like isoform X1 n=1 Tax=Amblyraja radiata TaxID=386614 RepID=UPI00140314DE|nr:radial spoke head 10 homolog B-like isoform X1 [Amblyraja radiata]
MAKEKRKRKGKEDKDKDKDKEKEKEKEKIKLKKGKSGDWTEETALEPEAAQSDANLTCRVVSEAPEEGSLEPVPEEPESHEVSPEVTITYYEEPILTKLIVASYEGEKMRGLYEGVGVAQFQGGHVYEGMFSEGMMHGRGTYMWANGIKYEGDFAMNTPTGHGTYTWTDGSTYVGEVQNGIRHRQGTFTCGDRSISYTGDWSYGKRHGKGTIYYNEEGTSWYQGDWVNNVREGWGVRRYKSGNVYDGEWKNFTRHGEGTMSWISTNEEYTGQWENGIQHGFGNHTWFLKRVLGTQYPLRNQYVGEFVKGVRQGHGKFFYASGAMYSGEWLANKKHGFGTFLFKNGRTFEGEFLEDRMAEFPNFSIEGMNTPDLSTIRTESPVQTGNIEEEGSKSAIRSILQHNVELDIASVLEKMPEGDRQNEVLQLEYAILRNFTQLKKIYSFYSSLGHQQSPDNAFLLSQLQFWRFLKDCKFHHYGLSLAIMDRILHEQFTTVEDTHSPFDTLLLGKFLSYIVILAYHIYHKEHEGQRPILEDCFSKLMANNLIPYACVVHGRLFQERECTTITLGYANKCWDVYRTYCEQNRRPANTKIMTMRHFLWMLKDLNLLSKHLTATRVVQILSQDNPAVSDGTYHNMDIEMVFLEFLEALLSCAAVYVTKRMLENSEISSGTSSGVNLTHLSSTVPAQARQEPIDLQVIIQEYISPEPNGRGAKSLLKKRGEANGVGTRRSERRKNKASASSAEKSTKASAHHDQGKSAAVLKSAQKEEELSQNISQLLPGENISGDSQSEMSDYGKGSEDLQIALKLLETKAMSAKAPALKPEVKSGAELELWLSQICFFFLKRLFPAYEHVEVLKLEARKDILRQNELEHQARIKIEMRLKDKDIKCSQENESSLNAGSQSDEDDKNYVPHKDNISVISSKKSSGVRKKKKSV